VDALFFSAVCYTWRLNRLAVTAILFAILLWFGSAVWKKALFAAIPPLGLLPMAPAFCWILLSRSYKRFALGGLITVLLNASIVAAYARRTDAGAYSPGFRYLRCHAARWAAHKTAAACLD